ncbi:MAG: DegT/DnrJ/EryC1/StrS family aminotransferase [Limisphaerales bacterium]
MQPISMFKPYVNERAIALVSEVLRSGYIGDGPKVKEFEARLSEITGAPYPVAVNSGTSALHLAMVLAGVGPGHEVITTAQTMLATTTAVLMCGARPVFADVQYGTGNIIPGDIAHRIGPRTKAILTVDWAGYPCDYDEILQIAKAHSLVVVEDAAHALGATYRTRPIGSVSPFTCFSFQAIKHLTTGDGGLLCLPSAETHARAMQLRWLGIDRCKRMPSILGEPLWNVAEMGFKYHMNDIAAAIGLGNLEDIRSLLNRRREIVAEYRRSFSGVDGVELFERKPDRESADWLFCVHVARREDFCRALNSRGIQASVVHLRIDRNSICGPERQDLPELSRFTKTHVSLPLHPGLTREEVQRITAAVRAGW